jgi:hypothetical protein
VHDAVLICFKQAIFAMIHSPSQRGKNIVQLFNTTVPAWTVVVGLELVFIGYKVISQINQPSPMAMNIQSMGKDTQITKTNPFTNDRQHLELCYDHANENHFEC